MINRKSAFILYIASVCMLFACKKNDPEPVVPVIPSVTTVAIITDKACYKPGEQVLFSMDKSLPTTAKIRYRHLNQLVAESSSTATSWSWQAPAEDFTGYLVDAYDLVDGKEKVYGSVAVDVSSDWNRFPRYGFLSAFSQLPVSEINHIIQNLSRHHINGIQFQDWQLDHHKPLAGTIANPALIWKDIANRDTYLTTVKAYIAAAHATNMKAMSYNLAYGALSNAASDGVSDQWYLFTDASHSNRDYHPLPAPMFKSNIYLTDPSNPEWQQYLASRNSDVYQVFDFDGFHIDQLGNRNQPRYNYSGQTVDLPAAFGSFISAMKTAQPGKKLVMNAVNQYGQQHIANSPVDFLYSEVWGPNDSYQDLAKIIRDNDAFSNSTKKTVLAAYMNYDLASKPGFFNTPGVLLTNAVIFAFGGSHLELGEHMLGKEYFPNSNLQMPGALNDAMISYYDFLVAYENLLRDGGTINTPALSCNTIQMAMNSWPPHMGSVVFTGRDLGNSQVIHLINFANASSLLWRDNSGTQPVPKSITKVRMTFTTGKAVKKIWVASPDLNHCNPEALEFSIQAGSVSFTLPELRYWDMIVVDYQ